MDKKEDKENDERECPPKYGEKCIVKIHGSKCDAVASKDCWANYLYKRALKRRGRNGYKL